MHLCNDGWAIKNGFASKPLMCQANISHGNWNGRCLNCLLLKCDCRAYCVFLVVPKIRRNVCSSLVRRARLRVSVCVCVWVWVSECACWMFRVEWKSNIDIIPINCRTHELRIYRNMLVQLIILVFQASTDPPDIRHYPFWAIIISKQQQQKNPKISRIANKHSHIPTSNIDWQFATDRTTIMNLHQSQK